MRVGEYAHSNGWDYRKVRTGADLAARQQGVPVSTFAKAHEEILWFKGGKADQEGAGAARNHFRSGDRMCPVLAAQWL